MLSKHKLTRQTWWNMYRRCNDPKTIGYENYGGRGIKVCERWKSFENFLADMGDKERGYSIERINNDGDYEPENCKWIPVNDQWRNRRETRDWSAMAKRKWQIHREAQK